MVWYISELKETLWAWEQNRHNVCMGEAVTYIFILFLGPGLLRGFGTGIPLASSAAADLFEPGAGPLRFFSGTAAGVGASPDGVGTSVG